MTNINLREASLKIFEQLNNGDIFIKEAIDSYFSLHLLEKHERAFINRVVAGTVENMIKIDYIIDQFSKVKTTKLKKPILYILRISVYQAFFMDSIPDNAICNEAVKLVKKRKLGSLAAYTNGVLRNIMRNKDKIVYPNEKDAPLEYLSVEYSMPIWLLEYLNQQYEYDILKQICKESNIIPNITIRLNKTKCNEHTLISSLEDNNVEITKGNILPYAYRINNINKINELESFKKGFFQVQDESSMIVGEVASPKENDKILDVCAAPGGKTTHLAELLNNKSVVYSRDISDEKIYKIKENCDRLGLINVNIEKKDALELDEELINKMDTVLADVPCSGLGIISKKPDIKYNVSEEGIMELINIQRKILDVVKNYVKKGGILIYSTCTINKNENIENVDYFLKRNSNFKLEEILFNSDINTGNINIEDKCVTLLPSNISDGFFIAKLKRIG